MMKKINYKIKTNYLAVLAGLFFLSSCNKDLEQLAPIPTPVYPSGNGIAATLAANANYTMYAALITRGGMAATLNDTTKTFTIFATDNNGMKIFVNAASGGLVPLGAPDATFLGFINGSLPAASAAGIVQYNVVGQKLPLASIGSAFPNYPYTSQIILDPTQPFVRLPIFPVRGTPYSYVNNVPLIATDMLAANGIIHTAFSVAAPPSATLRDMIKAEPTLSYFRAAILRGDSAADVITPSHPVLDSTKFLNYLLGYGVTNMTVLTPNDAAMQPVLFGAIYQGLIAQGVLPATAFAQATALSATPAGFNYLPVATVKGIMAYHFLATNTPTGYTPNIRVFSVNTPSTATFVKTLVNSGISVHPGVKALAVFAGPTTSSVTFQGYTISPLGVVSATGTPANVVKKDNLAVNGVYHIIDNVLLPQ